jgi:hypothetical protein
MEVDRLLYPDAEASIRFYFKFRVEHIPGIPGSRSLTIANAFLQIYFHRDFTWDRDFVHTPCNIDADTGRAHMLLDFNVKNKPIPGELEMFEVIFDQESL